MMRNVIALAFALLAAANASNFLENPTKPSTAISGASDKPIQASSADVSSESDDAEIEEASDAEDQDALDVVGDSSVAEVGADDASETTDGDEEMADETPDAKDPVSLLEQEDDVEMIDADDDKSLSVADDDNMDSGLESMDTAEDGEESADDVSNGERMDASEESVDETEGTESALDDTEPGEMSDEITDFGIEQSVPEDMVGEWAPATSKGDSKEADVTSDSEEHDTLETTEESSQDTKKANSGKEHAALETTKKSPQTIEKAKPLEEHATLEAAGKSTQAIKKETTELSKSNEKAVVSTPPKVQSVAKRLAKLEKNDEPLSADGNKLFQAIRMQVNDLKDKVYAGPKFKAKVAALCKKYSEMPHCDSTMKEVVFCKLLRRSEPKAAAQICSGVSMDPAKYLPRKEDKKANLVSTSSSIEVKTKQMVEKFAKEMADDLELNFDKIVPLSL